MQTKRHTIEIPASFAHLAPSVNNAVSLWFLGGFFVNEHKTETPNETKKTTFKFSLASKALIDNYCHEQKVTLQACVVEILAFAANLNYELPVDSIEFIAAQNQTYTKERNE